MIISDKQELRRCVKQLVRRAQVCEAAFSFDVVHGEIGVEAMLDLWASPAVTPGEALARAMAEHTPFDEDAMAMFAALDAMDMPTDDLNRAQAMVAQYERSAYVREVMDTLRLKCALIRVPMGWTEPLVDERFEPLLVIDDGLFVPGRYGVDYADAAKAIAAAAQLCNAHNVALDRFDAQALRYCALPLCQDEGVALHVRLQNAQEIEQFALLLDAFDGVRALVSAPAAIEEQLVDAARQRIRLLVCLSDVQHLPMALGKLGTRFVVCSTGAKQPEQLLGRWLLAKEEIWQALAQSYLPLARAGYVLRSDAIERDVRRILSENLLHLCRPESI